MTYVFDSPTIFVNSWQNTFLDLESGIDFYEWAVGSNPGHADILPFITSNEPQVEITNMNLQEGHSYYLSVKVCVIKQINLIHIHNQCSNKHSKVKKTTKSKTMRMARNAY